MDHVGTNVATTWKGRLAMTMCALVTMVLSEKFGLVERRRRNVESLFGAVKPRNKKTFGRQSLTYIRRVRRNRLAPPIDRLIGLPHMRADVQWHRVEGLWFEVTFRPVTEHSTTSACYDVLLKRIVTPHQRALLWQRYGSATLHAHRKHQLDGKTLSRFSLVD